MDKYKPHPYVELSHPEWSKNATIYEVNVRQFTQEGTFKAFAKHLPRLKEMGVDILWLMPIHPIGEKNRKGSLGSYYSVKDYYAVNPEFGDMDDFKTLVKQIHDMGMYVIIDWVANHSAWDNPLTESHPEWYTRTKSGNFQPTPWYDWDDIIDFDYDQPGIREYMTKALRYWVEKADIDGYRCDVAGFIPVEFWDNVRAELEETKDVFMLAEWESRDLHKKAFDMTYSWTLWTKLYHIANGKEGIFSLHEYLAHDVNTFPRDAYRMNFVDNHDKNSWEGNPFKNFGPAQDAAIVFTCVANGMPLIYSGQEAGLDRSLAFFEKDEIEWKKHSNAALYTSLFDLKHKNEALWNGSYGGLMVKIPNDSDGQLISFVREKNGDRVLAIFNYTDKAVSATLDTDSYEGEYVDWFTKEKLKINGSHKVSLDAWSCQILTIMQ